MLSALYDPLKGDSMQKHVQEAELLSNDGPRLKTSGFCKGRECCGNWRPWSPHTEKCNSVINKELLEVTVSARGEHVLAAAGEVHLERCIKDLKDRFVKVRLEVSSPYFQK